MANHELHSSPETCHWGYFDSQLPPQLRIKSGDTATIHCVSGAAEILPGEHFPDSDLPAIDLLADEPEPASLADWLASARDLAHIAHTNEDRTRGALYAAIGRAWDFALAAQEAPADFAEMIADAGLTMQAAFGGIVLGASVDAEYFTGIAKVRAARALWARLTEACGISVPARVEVEEDVRLGEQRLEELRLPEIGPKRICKIQLCISKLV